MSTKNGFLPTTDAGLLTWAQNFAQLTSEAPSDYGLSDAQAAEFNADYEAYAAAFAAAKHPNTRTSAKIAAKDDAAKVLRKTARLLASIVYGQKQVTNEQLIDLGLTVRDREPTPVPPPAFAPDLDLVSVTGRTVKILMHGPTPGRRRPPGVAGASIFSFIGDNPPANPSAWKFETNTTRMVVNITMPDSVPPGTKVWFTGFFFSPTAKSGPAADPIKAYTQFGGMSQAA